MDSSNNILSYFIRINKDYIHPKGKIATDLLFSRLKPQKDEKILELGFGTGASLVQFYSANKEVKLSGVEINEEMIRQAVSRLRFCGAGNKINLCKLNNDGTIPFKDNYFDKVYIESVLGIQEGERLKNAIIEINRVLKPNGIICINELIWLPHVKQKEIDFINEFGKNKFGIIQANGTYKSIQDWADLLEQQKFRVQQIDDISGLKNKSIHLPKNYIEALSDLFSLIGKIKGYFTSSLRKEWKLFKKEMETFKGRNNLAPYLITACNKK